MSRYYGSKCDGVGHCTGNWPGWWCESDNQGGCTDGGVGDIGSGEWSQEEYHAKMQQSKTKYVLDAKGCFIECGLFLAADCIAGDRLIAVLETAPAFVPTYALYADEKWGRVSILSWQFVQPQVTVLFERGDERIWSQMPNPAYKGGC